MKKIILRIVCISLVILGVIVYNSKNPYILRGGIMYDKDTDKFKTANIADFSGNHYSFKKFDTKKLKKIRKFLTKDTSSSILCLKGTDNWALCYNNNSYYLNYNLVPEIEIKKNKFQLSFGSGESSAELLLIDGNKIKLPTKLVVDYTIYSRNNDSIKEIGISENDLGFSKKANVKYEKVNFKILDVLLNNK